jgi:hypothetical protein
VIYNVFEFGESGWLQVYGDNKYLIIPEYLFARHFDAEAFVIGSATPAELEKAVPFNYKSTLPKPKPKQLEIFTDTPVKESTTGDDK